MSGKKNFNDRTWVKIVCFILGILMVLAIVVMIISAFMPGSYAGSVPKTSVNADSEVSVGLAFGGSAVQSIALNCAQGFVFDIGGYKLGTNETDIIVAADGNEYEYNNGIIVNPVDENGAPDDSKGIKIIGGYHIGVTSYSIGDSTGIQTDNPVYIDKRDGTNVTYSFTKDNIDEYTELFKSSVTTNQETKNLSLDLFPAYIGGTYYMMVGSFDTEGDADEVMNLLNDVYSLSAKVFAPDNNVVTVHTSKNDILMETDIGTSLKVSPKNSGIITTGGNMYKGSFTFERSNLTCDAISVINRIPLDDYVKACLSAEISPSEDTETLKAAAIVFRTAALRELGTHKNSSFDVCSDIHCMKYIGCSAYSDTDKISNAVDATAGTVVTYDDSLIYPVYCRSAMSTTVSAKDAFGEDVPYLKSLLTNWEMDDSVFEDWKYEVSASDLYALILADGYTELSGSIKSVTINERSENSLYATSVTFVDIFGNELTVEGSENIRKLFGGNLPSSAFIVSKAGKPVTFNYYAEGGQVSEITRTLQGTPGYFIFCGEGVGSGVGLSLSGAAKLAKNGYSYDQILSTYYPGTELYTAK